MTFLFDNDVPDDLAYPIEGLRHRVVRMRNILPGNTPDAKVLTYAQQKKWVLVTCNRDDFLELGRSRPQLWNHHSHPQKPARF